MRDAPTNDGWFCAMRTPDLARLCRESPSAFRLAFWIAARARYKPEGKSKHGLTIGEAVIGDVTRMGFSPREYRAAKAHLAMHGYATFVPTNRGTIAQLTDTRLFALKPPTKPPLPGRQAKRQAEDEKTTSKTTSKDDAANATPARVCSPSPLPGRQAKRQAEGEKTTSKTTTTERKIVQRMDASSPIKNGEDAQQAAIAAQLAQLKAQRQRLSKQGQGADTPQLFAKRLRLLDDQIKAHEASLP